MNQLNANARLSPRVDQKTTPIEHGSALNLVAESFVDYLFHGSAVRNFIPEGRFEILFQHGSLFLHNADGANWAARPIGFVGGLHSKAYRVKPDKHAAECFGIRLKTNFTHWLIPHSLHQFKNGVFDIADIFGEEARALTHKLGQTSDRLEQFALIEQFLVPRIRPRSRRLDAPFEQMIWQNCSISVRELSNLCHCSDSHFRKLFYEEIGLSPKEYIKVVRTRKAITEMQSGRHDSLTEVAYCLGYFDQSHFISDFKSVTQALPSNYFVAASD